MASKLALDYNETKIRYIKEILNHDFDYILPRLHQGDFYLQRTPRDYTEQQVNLFTGRLG